MFSNLNKSGFGSTTPIHSFGFGNTTTPNQTPFGQTQFFGKSNTSGFGQTAPLFGSPPQQSTTLFSNTALPAFGGTTQQSGFGTVLFGQQQNANVSSGTNGLFQSPSTSSFGQQNRTQSFGFGSSNTTLFGQQQPQNFQPSTSGAVFGTSTGFGATTQMGTNIKFNPATGTDTMQKSGVTHSINTKHYCITCMKEYEGKSLEELRWEDYQANRKGQQNNFGGSTGFGAPASTAPSLFGQTENKTAFGQTSTFGNPATSGFNIPNQTAQPSLFGKPSTGFGSTPTTNSFSFNSSTSAFGSPNIGKTFGNQPTQNVFGAPATTQAPTVFGNNLFSNTTQNAGAGLFGKTTTQSVFSNQQPSFAFNQPATSQSNFFLQTTKPSTGFGNFAPSTLTTTSGFGQPTNLFSSQGAQNPFNAMQKPAQPTFGQPLQSGFGLGTQANTNSFFGGNKSLFGGNTPSSFFNPSNTGFMMNQQQQSSLNQSIGFDGQQNQDFHTHVEQIYDPFPHYNFLLDAIKGKTYNTTEPKALKEILDQAPMPVTRIEKNISKYRTLIKPRNGNLSYPGCKYALLDEVVDKSSQNNNLTFKTGKRLVLRKNVARPDRDVVEEYKKRVDSDDNDIHKSLFRNLQQLDLEKSVVLEQANSPKPFYSADNSENRLSNEISPFEETPVKDKPEKPKVLPFVLNGTEEEYNDSAHNTYNTPPKRPVEIRGSSTRAQFSGTVGYQDDELESNQENGASSLDVSTIDESDNNSESEDDSLPDNTKIPTSSTCGVKLSHLQYYTKPPLTQLHKYRNEKGECIVKGFTIGRIGYGSIYFPEPMDVANLNLDEIVQFRFREVTVYPDESKKPPIGVGLNRRAQITLKHVWPRNRITQETIREVRQISKTNFIERLHILARLQNATFIDYHPDTGSWLFSVEHFSLYKFNDVIDQQCEYFLLTLKDAPKQLLHGLDGTAVVEFEQIVNSDLRTDRSPDSLKFKKSQNGDIFFVQPSLFVEESISEDDSSGDVGISLPLEIDSVNSSSSERNISVNHYTLMYSNGESVNDSFITNSDRDDACLKGRCFKVRWSQGYKFTTLDSTLIQTGTLPNGPEDCCTDHDQVHIMDISELVIGNEQAIWEQYLKTLLKLSTIRDGSSGLPTFKLDSSLELLNKLYDVTQDLTKLNNKSNHLKYYGEVWKLCRILWGLGDVSVSEKRNLLSTWLRWDLAPSIVESEAVSTKDNVLSKLYKYYLSNEVSSASQYACENNYPAMSLLIAQKQPSTIQHLAVQYNQWLNNSSMDVIDEHLVKLYMLFGGTEVIRGSNIFRNMEWKQVLAMYLWYICPKNVRIEDVVLKYSQAFTSDGTASFPLTLHQNKISELAFDLKYRLLEFYSNLSTDLCKVLNPFGYTKHIGDYHLSWLLLLLFEMNNIGMSNKNLSYMIYFDFAAQLEAVGLWTDAIFVLLFVKDEAIKLRAVTTILERNIGRMDSDEAKNYETYLTEKLMISSELIHSIRSYMKDNERVTRSHTSSYRSSTSSKYPTITFEYT